MIHKQCEYCKQIGHLPEMAQYVDIGYINEPIEQLRRWGLKWAHKECAKKNTERWIEAIRSSRRSAEKGEK